MTANIGIAVAVFLACALEFSEALAAVFAASAKGNVVFPVVGALAALVVVLAVGTLASSLLTSLPSKPVHVVVGVTLLGIGGFWLFGAVK